MGLVSASLQEVIDFLQADHNKYLREATPQLVLICQIVMTIPASTCVCERSFSTLRRLKKYLRSTLGAGCLNNITILHTHLNLSAIIDS